MKSFQLSKILFSLLALLTVTDSNSAIAAPITIPLWPKTVPGQTNASGEEQDTTGATGRMVAGKRVSRIANVTNPTIAIYRPTKDADTGTAVIVCPGGGYKILAYDLEGIEVCEWLNSIGITGVLLKYRVPAPGQPENRDAALQDAQRAVSLVRSLADKWSIKTNRIGILGFSAGGHLSASLSTRFDKRVYEAKDEFDSLSCRPDFALLIYPAYLTGKAQRDKLVPELTVTSNTPPTFLIQTEDDGVMVECSLVYYQALKNAHVPAEMHLFAAGGHGYGLRHTDQVVTAWPKFAEEWLRGKKLLAPAK